MKKQCAEKHGAFAVTPVYPWEDEEEYNRQLEDARKLYNPYGEDEDFVVKEIIDLRWRRQRALCALTQQEFDAELENKLLNLEERFDKAEEKKFVKLIHRKEYKRLYGRQDQPALPSPPLAPEQPKAYQEMYDAIEADLAKK